MELLYNFFESNLGWGDYVYHRGFILFISLFFSILFLQSGLDKLFSFTSNLDYFKDHFKNTFFKKQVKFLLIVITFLECVTGFSFLYVLFEVLCLTSLGLLVNHYLIAIFLCLMTLSCLFLGQRIAQDYAGAVNLGIYYLIALLGLFLPVIFLEFL
ncbi:MAG: DoxX family protein [Flavobacteriales bacterium]|nr:DoxX family protein [Flavobacteriales bacterium]